jgi:CcmD family protein
MKTWMSRAVALAVIGWLSLGPALATGGLAHAQAPTTPDEDRSMAFRAVDGALAEDVDGGALMVAAYGVILVLLLSYVLYLSRIQAGTSTEIARLRAAIEKQRGYRSKPGVEGGESGDSAAASAKEADS